jgi:hypothetical protein
MENAYEAHHSNWHALPAPPYGDFFSILNVASIITIYLMIVVGVWSNWDVPALTVLFIPHSLLILFDKRIVQRVHLLNNRVHIRSDERQELQGLLCFCFVTDVAAFARQIGYAGRTTSDMTSNDIGQIVLLGIVLLTTAIRMLEFWLIEGTHRHAGEAPTQLEELLDEEAEEEEEGGGGGTLGKASGKKHRLKGGRGKGKRSSGYMSSDL